MNKIAIYVRIWFRAVFKGYPYWRVIYTNGARSINLHFGEAYGLAEVFEGKVVIDYDVEID